MGSPQLHVFSDEEFQQFRNSIDDLKNQVEKIRTPIPLSDKWVEHHKALQIFQCTSRTLQSYRSNGFLPYSKIGGKIFYLITDIDELLQSNYKTK
jgi:hypothetical protein